MKHNLIPDWQVLLVSDAHGSRESDPSRFNRNYEEKVGINRLRKSTQKDR